MRQVSKTIAQFHMLQAGDQVLAGVSGGPDSVALLHLLHSKAAEYGIQLYVAHVHHMLRPEADAEAAYVEQLAAQYDIPFRLYKINVAEYAQAHKLSLEQAGHIVRFQCFQDAKAHWQCNKLALGHHRDDRAESVLLHLVQGCGPDGLCAMPPVDTWEQADGSRLIRPLANVSKAEIVQYCTDNQLQYYIDATNLEPEFLRNRIRLALLPQLTQYNPQIAEALVRLQDIAGADLDYITQQAETLWQQYGIADTNMVQLPAEVFRTQHVALQRRLLRSMYRTWTGSTENLTYAQIEQMCSIAMQHDGTQMLSLAGGVQFVRQYDMLCIKAADTSAAQPEPVYWQIDTASSCTVWNGTFTIVQNVPLDAANRDSNTIYVDADTLSSQLVIRTRIPGDAIALPGRAGHKSIKKFFIDRKVPKEERDTIPLLVSNGEIVWIPGHYIADTIKITEQTKRISKIFFSPV